MVGDATTANGNVHAVLWSK
ncbi:hypothetical protein MMB74_24120 [Trinickia sp. Y13]|nr:hypothetical protein [Trinickia sp. Y13]